MLLEPIKLTSKDITAGDGILGAHTPNENFFHVTKGDFFAIFFANRDAALYVYTPDGLSNIYESGLPFYNLETLKDAFNETPGLAARIEDNKLVLISAEGIHVEGQLADELGLAGHLNLGEE
jgi:hypothetical protein